MLFYFLITYLFLIMFIIHSLTLNNSIPKFTWLFFFVISGIRFDVGWDFYWYYSVAANEQYNTILSSSLLNYQYSRIELIPKFLIYVSRYFNVPQLFMFLSSAWIMVFVYLFVKKIQKKHAINEMIAYAIFLFYPLLFLQSLGIIRQWMAISVCLLVFVYKNEKKKALFLIVIAILCHMTAIIAVVFLINKKFTADRFKLVLFLLGTFLIGKVDIRPMLLYLPNNLSYTRYLLENIGTGFGVIIYLHLALVLVLILFLDKVREKEVVIMVNYIVFGTGIYLLLINYGHVGPRLSMFFISLVIVVVPIYIKKLKIRDKNMISLLVVFSFSVIFLLNIYYMTPEVSGIYKSPYIPYKTCFSTNDIIFRGQK